MHTYIHAYKYAYVYTYIHRATLLCAFFVHSLKRDLYTRKRDHCARK